MAKRSQRILAMIFVTMFVLGTIGASAAVVWQLTQDDNNQNNQLSENSMQGKPLENFEPIAEVSELQKIDVKEGDGKTVKDGDTVTAHYTGAVAGTGLIFQSSKDIGEPATFPLEQVIKGWQQGVPGMKEGGTRRLIIPAELAYGANPPSADIPPNAALVFDIELVNVN